MKGKLLTTAILATLLVGSNAFASLARMAVMGAEPQFYSTLTVNAVNGSLWYDDDYNVFYNPAYVNDNKNYVTVDKGVEGGFFKSEMENYAYGLYFNRGGTGNAGAVNTNTGTQAPGFQSLGNYVGTATVLNTQRPIDLFFGGDTGIKWGAHVAWAYNRNQMAGSNASNNSGAEISSRYWHADLGAEVMGFEPFIGSTFSTKYQNNTSSQASTADLNEFDAGFRYKYEGWTPYFAFHKYRESGVSPVATTMSQTRHNIWGLGVGHDTKVADGVHVLKNIGFWINSVEDDNGNGIGQQVAAGGGPTVTTNTVDGQSAADGNKNFKDYVIPINVALEAEATSWLVLRAGIGYDFFNWRHYASSSNAQSPSPAAITDKNQSFAGNTTFRIGSTLKFGKLHVDSAFGTGSGAGAASLDGTNIGFDSQTFALVSASYHW